MHTNEDQFEALEGEEEEMPATERELAEDAQWKLIQKNTFTRWANEHLKTVNKHLADLETDLSDGLRLVALVEVLSGNKFTRVNKRPNFRTQKLENVTMSLKFLEEEEGIRIVNIGQYIRSNFSHMFMITNRIVLIDLLIFTSKLCGVYTLLVCDGMDAMTGMRIVTRDA